MWLGSPTRWTGDGRHADELTQISARPPYQPHRRGMERIELLTARIALYRRYLSEGADGDVARAYLWLIRRDEVELATLADPEAAGAPVAPAPK